MSIQLSSQLEKAIQQKIASGLYNSANEVVSEALNAMETQEQLRMIKLQKLRQDIQDGLDSGTATPWDADGIKQLARQRKAEKNKSSES
ncbi:MAG: type II toxin-antitoxin system ParD family antitoxin [Pseudomonadota bacterium]